jgi:FtsH-binding integral membrane protein|tara:strand:+ start:77 stop:274 length:198 start_codon:yes stop_codon:yes gene_type:complete
MSDAEAVLGLIIILTMFIGGIGYIVKKRIDAKKKTGSYGFGYFITIIVIVVGFFATVAYINLSAS